MGPEPFGHARYRPDLLPVQFPPVSVQAQQKNVPARRFRALDTDIYGNLVVSGKVVAETGFLRVGTDTDYLQLTASALGGPGIEALDADRELPGYLVFSDTTSFFLRGVANEDQYVPQIYGYAAGAASAVGKHYSFELGDYGAAATKYFDYLVQMTAKALDQTALYLEPSSFASTVTAPVLLVPVADGTAFQSGRSATDQDLDITWQGGGTTGGGLHTKQSNGVLPAMNGGALTNFTVDSTGSWRTVTGTVSLSNTSDKVRVIATCQARVTDSAAASSPRARVQISLDGGSTWTSGTGLRETIDASGDYASMTPTLFHSGTATGNIVARLQVWSNTTTTDFDNMHMTLIAMGDI